MEAMLSEFDYFSQQAIQTSVEDEYTIVLDPINTISGTNPITFEWTGAEATAASLKDSKIMVRATMLSAAGAALKADASDTLGAPVNNVLHSLFESMDLQINGKSVGESDKLYPYRAYFENLLSFSKDTLGKRGLLEGWYWDTPGKFADYRTVTAGTNQGAKDRALAFGKTNVGTLIGRPHIDLFHQERCIIPGCRIKLTMTPCKSKFCTLSKDDAESYLMTILSAKLLLRVKRLSPGLALAQEKMLLDTNCRFPYTKVKMQRVLLKSGSVGYDLPNVFTGQIPTRIIFGIAPNTAVSGANKENPFLFKDDTLSSLHLTVNGVSVPRTAITVNLGAEPATDVEEGYLSLLEAMDLDTGDKSLGFGPSDWGSSYMLFGFRLAPEPVGSGIWSVPRQGSVNIHLEHSTALAEASDLVILSEYPAMLELDRYRNVIG